MYRYYLLVIVLHRKPELPHIRRRCYLLVGAITKPSRTAFFPRTPYRDMRTIRVPGPVTASVLNTVLVLPAVS